MRLAHQKLAARTNERPFIKILLFGTKDEIREAMKRKLWGDMTDKDIADRIRMEKQHLNYRMAGRYGHWSYWKDYESVYIGSERKIDPRAILDRRTAEFESGEDKNTGRKFSGPVIEGTQD